MPLKVSASAGAKAAPPLPNGEAVDVPKPKRPLTSFNLFYRYKRQRVLALLASGPAAKPAIASLVAAPPGVEAVAPAVLATLPPEQQRALQRSAVRRALAGNLTPKAATKRVHRPEAAGMNGALSFVELGRLMNAAWKGCGEETKAIFRELAEEGRGLYQEKVREYDGAVARAKKEGKKRKAEAKRAVGAGGKKQKKRRPSEGKAGGKAKKAPKKRAAPSAADDAKVAALLGNDGLSGPLKIPPKKRFRASAPAANLLLKPTHQPHAEAVNTLLLQPTRPLPRPSSLPRSNSKSVSDVELSDESNHGLPSAEDQAAAGSIAEYLGKLAGQRAVVAPSPTVLHRHVSPPTAALPQLQVRALQSPPLPASSSVQSASLQQLSAQEAALRIQVRELESRLAQERLRARVRELELSLAAKEAAERQRRAQDAAAEAAEIGLLRETQLRAHEEVAALKAREDQLRRQLLRPVHHPLAGVAPEGGVLGQAQAAAVLAEAVARQSAAAAAPAAAAPLLVHRPAPIPPKAASAAAPPAPPKEEAGGAGIMALVNASLIHPLLQR
ncbi:hypothetical protein ACHAXT_001965 [Thalassiosira profunda]